MTKAPLGPLVHAPSPRVEGGASSRPPRAGIPGLARVCMAALLVLLACAASACGASAHPASEPNLLVGHVARGTPGVERAERSNDGALVPWADFWNTPATTILRSADDSLFFDLETEQTIEAAFLEGDNNDVYTVAVSSDGHEFQTIWSAPPVRPVGMRGRVGRDLHAKGRFVRVSASGGDGAYSIAEVAVYARNPREFPEAGNPGEHDVDVPNAQPLLLWGAACVLFLLLGCQGGRVRGVLFALPLVAASLWIVIGVLKEQPRYTDADISLLRAVAAAVGVLAILRDLLPFGRAALRPRRVTALFGLLAVAGVASFYNLGRPQFTDARTGHPSYVHNYDMRVYFPVAKYFRELKYDGLYLASVASYIDNHPGSSLSQFASVELRDLQTHETRRVGEVMPQIDAVRTRFSPERWRAFCDDMRYFQESMGRDYFSTMLDHGGNATPVWLTVANVLFRWTPASNATLLFGAALDPLLLLVLGWVLGRTFGWRTSFFCLLLFGANDYYMFGTDWAGATLRHDWMIALGFGAAALARKRWALGGGLLAYGGLIRAFPALAVFALAGPPLWWVVSERRRLGRLPSFAELRDSNPGPVKALFSAVATVVVAVLVSSVVLSPSAWPQWLHKASVLSAGDHINHLSLRTVASLDLDTLEGVGGWFRDPRRVVFFSVGVALYSWLAIKALRGAGAVVAAMIGLLLIPVYFYPANYYFHVVFLLPMLAVSEGKGLRDRAVWLLLGLMCVAEYATTWANSLGRHFMGESVILMVTYLLLLLVKAYPLDEWFGRFVGREQPGDADGDGDGDRTMDEEGEVVS